MIYYINSKGKMMGRLYEYREGWVAEVGRYEPKAKFCRFFATRSANFKTYHQAEKYLFENGGVMVAIA